jgi:hypothetical protein
VQPLSLSAGAGRLLLVTVRVVAEDGAVPEAALRAALHRPRVLLGVGVGAEAAAGHAVLRVYAARGSDGAGMLAQCGAGECGGAALVCPQCLLGEPCAAAEDCFSGACERGRCAAEANGALAAGLVGAAAVTALGAAAAWAWGLGPGREVR